MLLGVTSASGGITAATSYPSHQAAKRHPARPAPDQSWGSAAGKSHVVGASGNRTVPQSLRGRYPLRPEPPLPEAIPNKAQVVDPPVSPGRGFEPGVSQELVSRREANRRTYVNPDGTETTEVATQPLNFRAPDGTWQPIDSTLRRSGASWRNAAGAVEVQLADTADAAELARVSFDSGHALGFGLSGAVRSVPRITGDTATYPAVRPGVDLELTAQSGGVKETLVLRSADAPHSYLFPLYLNGLTAELVAGRVVLRDDAAVVRAVIPAGYMLDAGTPERGPAPSTGVTYRLVSSAGRPALEVTLDSAWLRDPARVYPVRVDPSVDQAGADSAMVVQGSSSRSGSSELVVGKQGGSPAASYFKFAGLTSQLPYHTIYGAQLQVVNYDAPSCKSRPVSVHPVTQSWSASGSYSYPGPSVGSALASKSFAYGYIALGQSQSACPAQASLFDLGKGGRDLVQGWVNGQPNNGLSLRASATDSTAWKRFAGSGTANPPRLYVTHSPYNASYAIPNPVPVPPVLQNQSGKVTLTVTNLSAMTWTPGSYYLAYRAYNASTGAAVTQQRAADLTANVARGAKVNLEATIKPLPPGKYFLDFTMVKSGGVVFTDQQVPPGRIVLEVFNVPPVVQELHPPNGYQAPTLTPQLWARAVDIDAPPGSSLTFKFEYCERTASGTNINCANSGYLTSQAWTLPAGALSWSKTYVWRVAVKDGLSEVFSDWVTLLTSVPQPEVTSHVAGAPYGSQEREFDPQVGNFSTGAVDASVTTVGPELRLARTYNSLDPRRDLAFGAGWVTQYDMRFTADDDGSGNVVVTYPDGQQVRFGKNPNGTFAAPAGRVAGLTVSGSNYVLSDRAGMTYTFSGTGRLTKITDAGQRSIVLTYDLNTGLLAKATVSNSQTNTAGRSLRFTWSGGHVVNVITDPVNGTSLTWTYTYNGDLLTRVCAPGGSCTAYDYAPGSHYRTSVLDSRPESYYRLGETQGTATGSEIAVNLGKDAGVVKNVTLGVPGAAAGTDNTAMTFNGTTSVVELPKGTLKKNRDAAVELWFKISVTQTGGPLLGYQDKAIDTTSSSGAPILYVGTDGRLRGQFRTSAITPITSPGVVNDNRWHHAVLSAMGSTQTLYLDGNVVGTLTGSINHSALTFNQIGAGYATSPTSWTGWGSAAKRTFSGSIDEVAVYAHPLGSAAVNTHYRHINPADQLVKTTLPSGKVATEVAYDTGLDRVREYTDRNGGTWKIGAPAVSGGDTDLRRSVQVLDPADRPYLYEYDALAGRLLRSGSPMGLSVREEDKPGYRSPSPTPSPSPSEVCTSPDPGDPQFCTIIPGGSGGPVFVGHPLDGMAIRSFSYNDQGFQNVVTNENGDTVTLGYDSRGNVTSRRTCRTSTQCFTAYYTYPATVTNPFDPRNDLPLESRDGRSASATDTMYRTTYTYASTGELLTQANPDGGQVRHTYTTGGEAAVGGGAMPPALPLTTTDPRGAVTRYAYYSNGDLARVTEPSGLVTNLTYDALGRRISETEVSDTFPAGVTATYAYDALSRVTTVTEAATTDEVNGVRHQRVMENSYDADSNVIRTEVRDALGGVEPRVTTYGYDDHNRLEVTTDAEGNETTLGFDQFGNRTWMVDANGNRYEYAFTARNQIAEVRFYDWHSDPPGTPDPGPGDYLVLNSYAYDYAGRMVRQTDAMGQQLEYSYYRDDLISKITLKDFHNPDGSKRDYVIESTTYDGAGNVLRQEAADGDVVTENAVNRTGQVTSSVLNPTGLARRTDYVYDLAGNVTRTSFSGKPSNVPWAMSTTGQVIEYGYDVAGNLIRQTAVGATQSLTTRYQFNQRGQLIGSTDPRGNVTGADPQAYTSTFRYDELGQQVSASLPAVAVEQNGGAPQTVNPTSTVGYDTFGQAVAVRDELGNVIRTGYDRLGQAVEVTAPSYTPVGGLPITPVTRTSYDGIGNVVEVTDPRGNVARYSYDQLSRVTVVDQPGATNDERARWQYTYTRTGELLSTVDPTGARMERTYDDLDRLTTLTQAERYPVADNFTTRYSYDDAGNLTEAVTPSGARTTMVYDAAGDLTRSTSPTGVAVLYGYDLHGRQIRMSDGLGRTERADYDDLGRARSESDLKTTGETIRGQTYGYDPAGNLTSSINALGVTTTYGYNAVNQLVQQVEPVSATKSITTSFGYDAAGNRTRYTDGRGNATVYTVNSLGLPASVIEPSTPAHPAATDRTWTASYNASGQAVRLIAPGGVTRDRTYDAAGRMTRESGTGAEVATVDRTFGYDLASRLTSASAPGGVNTYGYNDRGGLLRATGPGGAASFAYNSDGQLNTRTDAAGTAQFGYSAGRLATVRDGGTSTTQTLGYDGAGSLKTIDYGLGRVRSYTYDDLGRVASDVLRNSLGAEVSSVSYGYNLDDRMTSKNTKGAAGAGDNTYGYDLAGRLTSWTVGGTTTPYGWDDSGNLIQSGTKTATFDARNRLISDGDFTYTYTARGTLASKTSSGLTEQLTFDAFDRLVREDSQVYEYDALNRVAKRNGTAFKYAGLSGELVGDGTEIYARGPGDELLAIIDGTQKRLVVDDEHGDVVGGFDPADGTLSALPDSTAYDPFGKRIATAGGESNIGFQGDWTDPDTDQVNMGARWYNPSSGAFTARDSVTYVSGDSILANRYTYAAGDPLGNTDPDGHWPSCGWCKKAVNAVSNAVSSAYHAVSSAVSSAWGYASRAASRAWDFAKTVVTKVVSVVKHVAKKVTSAAKWVYHKAKSAVKWVANKVSAGTSWLKNKAAAAASWAKQKAAAAKRAAIAAAHRVTNAAKAAVAYVAKHNPLPAVAAALKPVMSGIKTVVSAVASAPAAVVSTVRNVVHDAAKSVEAVYQKAVEAAGTVVATVSKAATAVSEFVQTHAATIAGIVAGAVVGIGCGIAIGWTGVGAVACGALAGAVGSLVHDLVEGGHSWQEMAGNAVFSGAVGALTGGLASVGGAAIGAGARALGGGLRSAGQAAVSAGRGEVANITSGRLGGLAGRGCNSFTPQTAVLMANGTTKAIEDVRVGDVVLATDPTTGKTEARPVTDLIVGKGEKKLVEITVDLDGVRGNETGKLTATDGHPFWVPSLHEWVKAADLQAGALLRTSTGTYVQVTAIRKWTAQDQWAHNLTVDGLHTYYVMAGASPVLVHNCGADGARFVVDSAGTATDRLGARFVVDSAGTATDTGSRNAISLGRYPAYLKDAQATGSRTFNVGDAWEGMAARADRFGGTEDGSEIWIRNSRFLEDGIRRGSTFRLASDPLDPANAGSFFLREVGYLKSRGYVVNADHTEMIQP
jgi:RHS repeat-associated protein